MRATLCCGIVAAVFLVASVSRAGEVSCGEKLGWKAGIQCWTFNRFTLYEAIQKAKAVGAGYIEAYPNQRLGGSLGEATLNPDLPLSALAAVKIWLDRAHVKLVAYGVTGLGPDEKAARKVFDFAKVMGIEVINSEPEARLLPMIDKLCQQYGIKVGLHNHPRPSRYWNPDTVLGAIKGVSPYIGACADTGHWVRSGLDPLACLKKLSGRIVSFHLKDLNKKGRGAHDVPWGSGVCDIEAIMKEMRRQRFTGPVSVEYEYDWLDSMPEVKQCLSYFEEKAAEILRSK